MVLNLKLNLELINELKQFKTINRLVNNLKVSKLTISYHFGSNGIVDAFNLANS